MNLTANFKTTIVALLLGAMTFTLIGPPVVADESPLSKDKTGLKWVLPFKEAQAKAEKETRLLMIKPVAFGTTPDGGW